MVVSDLLTESSFYKNAYLGTDIHLYEDKYQEAISEDFNYIFLRINAELDSIVLGKESDNYIERLMQFIYFLNIIQLRRDTDKYNGVELTNREYAELYEIDCISEKLKCIGINTIPWLRAFDLLLEVEAGDGEAPAGGYTNNGINYMKIQGDGSVHPKFKIY